MDEESSTLMAPGNQCLTSPEHVWPQRVRPVRVKGQRSQGRVLSPGPGPVGMGVPILRCPVLCWAHLPAPPTGKTAVARGSQVSGDDGLHLSRRTEYPCRHARVHTHTPRSTSPLQTHGASPPAPGPRVSLRAPCPTCLRPRERTASTSWGQRTGQPSRCGAQWGCPASPR